MATQQKVQLVMPEMGESVTEGTVLEWHVAEGDSVEEGDTMVEVSTDKVDAEVPAPASGTVTKILVQPDEETQVGKPMAEIDPNGGSAQKEVEAPADEADSKGSETESAEDASSDGDAGSNGATAEAQSPPETDGKATSDDASVSAGKELEGGGLEIVMPEMGESVAEGTILEWHVAEGDQIAEGDTVVEVSTDKVDAEVPAPADGTITKILVGPDETIEVGKPMAVLTKGDAPSKEASSEPATSDSEAGSAPAPAGGSTSLDG